MSEPLEGTQSAAKAIARVSYTHDALIDAIVANPAASQNELAAMFGYTPAWLSRVKNSDAFLARLAQRKAELVDPSIAAGVEEKLRSLADRSLDILTERLSVPATMVPMDVAMKAAEMATKALGYGARKENLSVQNNFVVALPGKAVSAESWSQAYSRGDGPSGEVVEGTCSRG